MEFVAVIVVVAAVFGICFLVDKGFQKLFRNQAEHMSGKAVRLSKRYVSFGIIIAVVGLAAVFFGMPSGWALPVGGLIMIVMGLGLVMHYMSYGIFYDTDSFIFMSYRKRGKYYYRDIQNQQLYNNQGHLLIELFMSDGKVVQIQSGMEGAFDFMDHAFGAWLRQTGKTEEDCPFHDPANCCWFPPVEG